MRVELKKWMKENAIYVILWVSMGLVLLGMVIRELGILTLVVIAPFLPPFIIAMVRMVMELRKRY